MDTNDHGIAIIGMSGRFPGAGDVDEFWRNLVAGVESISFFSDEELAASGLDVAQLRSDPGYVAARGIVRDAEWFDAAFFNVSPREAEVIDPQQRLFLEAAWEVLENAGYDPARTKGYVGVYAGMSTNTYFWNNVSSHPDLIQAVGRMATIGDFLATRVAYKLNLRGPALSLYTACSTSLVAVAQACQALLGYQCDIALAGGVSVAFPQKRAYRHEGGMLSPDGHCRPFDARAAGTNFSDGLGIVALKRVAEAVNDGDQIYAVIKGFGLNNDGSAKVGFAAPSVHGQAEVIALAQAQAGFEPATISYIETHGTATPLGDPIEIEALTQAFRAGTARNNFCAIGSVKGNIGHTDAAAGMASLIKTALALQKKTLPPSLHFTEPNPKIDFARSPFFVNATLAEWKAGPTPRRAGVSGFGVGGTNVHLVLEEAPRAEPSGPSRDGQLLLLSARSGAALDSATTRLHDHLQASPDLNLADAAFTLQSGRRVFDHRGMLVCRDAGDAIEALATRDPKRLLTQQGKLRERPVVFMFPGQGAQRVNLGAELYRTEAAFKKEIDRCAEILVPHLDLDLRQVLFPPVEKVQAAESLLNQTRITQPALFVIEYALARLWMSWGVQPCAMIGHSLGEYVAGCLAGVFTLEDALTVVARRGQLVQALPEGAMLAVRLPENEVGPLPEGLSVAAINAPSLCVVSGPSDAIAKYEAELKKRSVAARRLQTSHAFHSAMMDPLLPSVTELMAGIQLRAPSLPYVSNVTGRWITDIEATDPHYWAGHLRQPVRFADGLGELLKNPENILLEVGPGQTLSGLAGQHPGKGAGPAVLSSFPPSNEPEVPGLLGALGRLWLAGAAIDWSDFSRNEKRRRIPLPTYPFERKRFWVEPARPAVASLLANDAPSTRRVDSAAESTEHALPDSDSTGEETSAGPPTVSRQKRILAILTNQFQALSSANLADVGPSASFMEMGLDSLFLGQANIDIEKRFGIKITFRQMFEDLSTLNALADYLDQKLPAEALTAEPASSPAARAPASATTTANPTLEAMEAQLRELTRQLETLRRAGRSPSQADDPDGALEPPIEPAEPRNRTGAVEPDPEPAGPITLPLTDPQRELWLASQAGDDASRAFNQVFAIRLAGRIDADAVEGILQQLVNRHDALRTTFAEDGSGQTISPTEKLNFSSRDLSSSGDLEQEREIAATLAREDQTPFDLAHGPLFRARLLTLSGDRFALILAAHHIILDGWSIAVLLREFGRLYDAWKRGATANLGSAMQYRQYVQWQNAPEHRAAVEAAEAYWLERFSRLPADSELPADRPRPSVKTYRAAQKSIRLDRTLYVSVKQAAAARDCTLFVFLLAALQAWRFRLSEGDDLVIGIPAAGQLAVDHHPDSRWLVGHCVNTLPLRTPCDAQARFSDHLQTVKGLLLDAYEHQNVTVGTLVRKLRLRTDLSRAPLIPVLFNLGRAGRQLQLPEAHISFPPKGFNFFDLNIEAHDTGDDIQLVCHYNIDLFDEARVGRMLDHFRTLLAAAVEDPDRKVMDLPLLTGPERDQILVEWNRTEIDHPASRCLPELIDEQATRTPEAVAVVFGARQLTYRELNARANQLARHLQKLGVGPDSLVALCVDRSLEMVVGMLGILKAGGGYVPLDPKYPPERLAFVLQDANAQVLLTQAHLVETMPASAARVIRLDADWPEIARESEDPAESAATAKHLAYVIYTSGSTGQPKGVEISHEALVNFLLSMRQQPGLTARDVLLAVTTISFDIAGLEIFLPLVTGARVVILSRDEAADGFQIVRQLKAHRATVLQATPSTWRMLLDADWPGDPQLKMLCGGEAFSRDLADRLLARGGELWNMYGPTETTIWSSTARVAPDGAPIHIGRPIANTRLYILDAQLQPVPIGVPGELHIGGMGLARGYHHRPELTAQKFIPDPFDSKPGARLYRTGDLARFLADGNIECLGRLDHQVKIRGFRIELGEIETALAKHPGLLDAVVVAREDRPGDKRLVAYTVHRNGSVGSSDLREYLLAQLPDYMVPSAFVALESLPLTPNGKVDRKALPRPDFAAVADEAKFVAPGTPTETALAEIWREVLDLQQVGIHDSFFDLGGHSILAVQLIGKINKTLGRHVPIPVIFQNPTIGKLATILDRENPGNREVVRRAGEESTSPLVAFQTRGDRPPLFFLHGDWLGGGFYCGRLSQHLGDDQPFYVLPPWGSQVALTLEEMAADQLVALREHTPHGPYLLGGYCIGATVAAEMARQLAAKGEEVRHLFLIDPPPLSSRLLRGIWPVVDRWGEIRKWDVKKKIGCFDRYGVSLHRWLRRPARDKWIGLAHRLGFARRIDSRSISAEREDNFDEEILNSLNYETYILAYRRYEFKPLSVPATLYLPEQSAPARLSWTKHAGTILPEASVEMVPGNHRTCVVEHTSALADKMKEALGLSKNSGSDVSPKAHSPGPQNHLAKSESSRPGS